MDFRSRYLQEIIRDDLNKKMIFIGGPRQVGKTTLARMISQGFRRTEYLNWDNGKDRRRIMEYRWDPDADLLIFDEIHKYAGWKSFIKGVWDKRIGEQRIIVTGSSKLNIFRRGGDSLLDRYLYFRLHPFSLQEMGSSVPPEPENYPEKPPELTFEDSYQNLDVLFEFGGFPEPLLSRNRRTLRRWQQHRFETIVREDIRDTETVHLLAKLEMLGYLIPDRTGSPLSLNSLSRDLEVSQKTVGKWIEIYCRNYFVFKVRPYFKRLHRVLKKQCKYYLWDWSILDDKGIRFENLIALHLLKYCHYYHDVYGIDLQLFYLRDLDGREVDFLLVWDGTPWLIAECKLSPGDRMTSLRYFAEKLGVNNRFQVVLKNNINHIDNRTGVRVISADYFLTSLI